MLWLMLPLAAAQEPAAPEEMLSPEELAEIEAALSADAEAAAATVAATPRTPPPPGSGSGGNMNPDIAFIADLALAAFSADAPLQSGAHDPTVNGVNLQQLEMALEGSVDPYFHFDANIVFTQFGVEIEEVYATTTALPGHLQVRAGQFLTRFGRANPTHPHSWDFVDQALPIGRLFGGEGNRGPGAELSWLAPLPWYVEVTASETMLGGAATGKSWSDAAAVGVDGPADLQTTAAVKQFFPLGQDWSLMWGLSWAGGPNGTGRTNRSEVYGTDLFLKFRPITTSSYQQVSLHSEWFHRRMQVPDELYTDLSGFTQLAWRFSRRWTAAARHEYGGATAASDGEQVVDPFDPVWQGSRHRYAANATFWPTEFSRLRLQGAVDLPDWEEAPAYAAFLAFEFNVGAHGAHAF